MVNKELALHWPDETVCASQIALAWFMCNPDPHLCSYLFPFCYDLLVDQCISQNRALNCQKLQSSRMINAFRKQFISTSFKRSGRLDPKKPQYREATLHSLFTLPDFLQLSVKKWLDVNICIVLRPNESAFLTTSIYFKMIQRYQVLSKGISNTFHVICVLLMILTRARYLIWFSVVTWAFPCSSAANCTFPRCRTLATTLSKS